MSRMWIALAALPLTLLAGVTSGTADGCVYAGGETEMAPMIPASAGNAQGFYLHAASDATKSGLYAEDNGKAGLQLTDRTVDCGEGARVVRKADTATLQ